MKLKFKKAAAASFLPAGAWEGGAAARELCKSQSAPSAGPLAVQDAPRAGVRSQGPCTAVPRCGP